MDSLLLIVAAPSGAGKSTLCRQLLAAEPRLTLSCSCTTRPPRPGERHGVDYFFIDEAEFERMVRAGEFIEWFPVHDHRYGTPHFVVEQAARDGRDLLFDVDVQGAALLRKAYPRAVSVFILPPSALILEQRLRGRGTDDEATIRLRLGRTQLELAQATDFQYLLVNDELDRAAADLRSIYRAEQWAAWRHQPFLSQFQAALEAGGARS